MVQIAQPQMSLQNREYFLCGLKTYYGYKKLKM